jgi:hypothetical protein
MQAYGRDQTLFEPGLGGVVSDESATGNKLLLPVDAFCNISHRPRKELAGLLIERLEADSGRRNTLAF